MRRIQSIIFEPDGAVFLDYLDAEDIRGQFAIRRSIRIGQRTLEPEVEILLAAAQLLVADALEQWEGAEPDAEIPTSDDTDDELAVEEALAAAKWKAIEADRAAR